MARGPLGFARWAQVIRRRRKECILGTIVKLLSNPYCEQKRERNNRPEQAITSRDRGLCSCTLHAWLGGDGECGVLVMRLNREIALTIRKSGAVFARSKY
jgi:hypothetical protein